MRHAAVRPAGTLMSCAFDPGLAPGVPFSHHSLGEEIHSRLVAGFEVTPGGALSRRDRPQGHPMPLRNLSRSSRQPAMERLEFAFRGAVRKRYP